MTYTTCPSCGQKALPVASRCPRCGVAFEEQFYSRTTPRVVRSRKPLVLALVGLLIVLFAGGEWMRRRKELAERAAVPVTSPVAARAEPAVTRLPVQSQTSETVATVAPAPPAGDTVVPVKPVESPLTGHRRATSTWVNLRAAPDNDARVLGVLQPGEVVGVDSLAQGWYRVKSSRFPAGYVDRRLLDSTSRRPAP